MTDTPYNPNDPLFKVSRAVDGDLSDDQRRQLEDDLRGSAGLRREAEGLRAIDRAVRRWGEPEPDIDWEAHAALIQARIEEPDEGDESDKSIDRLLRRWAEDTAPVVDEDTFVQSVADRIRETDRRRRDHRPLIFRIGLPLAAAAAIVMAVTIGLWPQPTPRSERVVNVQWDLGRTAATPTEPSDEVGDAVRSARVAVTFARRPVDRSRRETRVAGMSFGYVGSGGPTDAPEPEPPV